MAAFMNYRKTPPIQFIPVFEAAARHLSFKKAAEELCVTAPAVGQQIKAFEHWLQRPLFTRKTRQLQLTDEGELYLVVAQQVMNAHHRGYTEFVRQFEETSLCISAPLFIAQELLMPNYLQFAEFIPNTELRVEARTSYVDFDVESVDAAIRFGDGSWPDLDCRKLCDAYVAPVCSPAYAETHSFKEINKLYQHRIIYAEPAMSGWGPRFWHNPQQKHDKIICDSYFAALKSAADGLGVALAIFPTTNGWVNNNRILLPYPIHIKIDKAYWLVTPKRQRKKPKNEALYRWLKHLFNQIPTLNTTVSVTQL